MNSLPTHKISVLMSVYNGEKYISETIESILNQSFEDFEFIIINDGSTDSSQNILNKFSTKDKRIIILNQKNIGLTKSLNKGVDIVSGKYIARQDCGDISLASRLYEQYNFMESNSDYGLVGTLAERIDNKGNTIFKLKPEVANDNIKKMLPHRNQFIHGSLLIRKNALLEIGKYRKEFYFAQDYDLSLRLMQKYKVHNVNKILYLYRTDTSGISFNSYFLQQEYSKLAKKCYISRHNIGDDRRALKCGVNKIQEMKTIDNNFKNRAYFFFNLGKQCFNIGDINQANTYFKKSLKYQMRFSFIFYYIITTLPSKIGLLLLKIKLFLKYQQAK